jgi:riboflavin-specific deaminase-like protein
VEFAELWPQRRSVEIDDYLAELAFSDRASPHHPFTLVNFVSSIDGRATVDGRSGSLGDDGDRRLFGALRRQVDAVLVGTGTLEAERYGRILRDPASRERRRERGQRAEPLACTLTRRGALPLDIPLFAEPEARVIVFTPAEIDLHGVRAHVEIVKLAPGEVTFTAALHHLRARHDVRSLLCEGGPRVFATMLHEGIVDQLFLTLAPKLLGGGEGPAITSGPPLEQPLGMSLDGLLERNGTLFLRYGRSE